MKEAIIIGIAGGTGCGKSTLIRKIKEEFNDDICILSHDFYYKQRNDIPFEERKKINYDHPNAFDTDIMIEHIKALAEGKTIERPVYDFTIHNRVDETVTVYPAKVIVVEGILIFVLSCQDLTNIYHNTVRNMSYIVFIALVILVLLSYSLSRKFADPFNSMVTSINRIAEGSFDEELNLKGFNEIEQLSDAFNTMMSRLRSLEDSRQEFVSNVSHELKTPLTSMKVLADSLNMQPDAPVEIYREFMQDITMEIDRETTIINDLLSLVKMDKTHSDINIGDVDVNAMLEALIKRVKPIAAKRNVTLQLEAAGQVSAQCDEIKMSLALSNLVENAIKYNVAGGWVHVSLDSDDQFFFVTVSDSGIGIPQEYQEKIFERFYRVDKARSRESGGTGLGLAITKTIVQMHHGAIKVSSKEEEGTTFSVRIPLVYHEEKEA